MDLRLVKRWMCCDKAQLLTSFEKFFKDVLLFRVLKSSDKIQIQNLSERPKISLALPKRLSTYLKTKTKQNSGLENEKSRTKAIMMT